MLSGDNFSSLATTAGGRETETRALGEDVGRTSSTMFSRVTARRGFPVFLSMILLNAIGGSAVSIFITSSFACDVAKKCHPSVKRSHKATSRVMRYNRQTNERQVECATRGDATLR